MALLVSGAKEFLVISHHKKTHVVSKPLCRIAFGKDNYLDCGGVKKDIQACKQKTLDKFKQVRLRDCNLQCDDNHCSPLSLWIYLTVKLIHLG